MASNLPSTQKENWAPNEVVKPEHTNSWGHAINTLSKAVPLYSACGNVYTATYTDNVYNLMPLSFTENTSNVTVDSYVDGMSVIFQCPTDNLANCSVNVNSLGTKTIKTIDNVNLPAGKLNSGIFVELKYDKTNDCFKFQQDFNKADRNFSNLTEEAEKHFLNKSQVTNCILQAPNGVATYESSTITVKSGLKVLIPNGKNANGTLNNIEYTVPSDIIYTHNVGYAGNFTLGIIDDGRVLFNINSDTYVVNHISELPTPEASRYYKAYVVDKNQWYLSDNGAEYTIIKYVCISNFVGSETNEITSLTPLQPVELAKQQDIDGMWVIKSQAIIDSYTSLTNGYIQYRSYDISNYLPNDGCVYEVLVEILGEAGQAAGAWVHYWVNDAVINGQACSCGAVSYSTTPAYVYGNGILPMSSRTLRLGWSATGGGNPIISVLRLIGYRKVR